MSPAGTAELNPGRFPLSAHLFRVFFFKLPQNRHPELRSEPVTFSILSFFCTFNQLYSSPPTNRHPERSASQICRVTPVLDGAESKDLKGVYPTQTVRTLSTTEARQQDLLRHALDGHGYIFSCTVVIFELGMGRANEDVVAGHSKMLASRWFSAPGKNRAGPGGRKAPSSMG